MSLLLFDMGIPGGMATAGIAAVGFFFVLTAVAYIMFRLLRRTVKMAFRMAIVAAVLVIALVGSISLYWFGSGSSSKTTRPAPARQR